ncbi:MAG: helicase-associated domain-containing protein, partial [Anaerolineae bacterium]
MLDTGALDPGDLADLTLDEFRESVVTQDQPVQTPVDPVAADPMLRQFLDGLTVAELRDIGRRRSFELRGTRKADIIDQLAASLRDMTGTPDFLAGLTREEDETLRALNTMYGIRDSLTWDEAQWAWNQLGQKGDAKALRQALSGLQEYGLLYRCKAHGGGEHYHWLPYLMGVRLPVVVPQVKSYPERKLRRLSHPGDTPPVPAALALLVAFAEQHPLRLRKPRPRHRQAGFYPWLGEWDHDPDEVERLFKGRYGYPFPGQGTVLTVPPPQPLLADDILDQFAQWLDGEREYASWLVLLAVAAGILTEPTGSTTSPAVQHERWEAWYSRPLDMQLHALFSIWWQRSTGLTELSLAQRREPRLRVQRTLSVYQQQFTPTDLAREFSLARGLVTRLLQGLPTNVWYDWFSFAEEARQMDPDYLHNYYGTDFWGFVVKGDKRLDPSRRGDWDRGYRPVLAAMLEGPLRWLGVVEVGYKGSNLVAFRLTPTGAWLLRGEGRPVPLFPEEVDKVPVAWLDDRTFRARPGPEAANVLSLAGTLAAPTRHAFVYELSDEGVQQVFARGVEPAAIAKTFEKAGASLPAAAHHHIEDLWSRFGHIHLYEKLTVLELADDLALHELLANTSLRQHMIHQFSSRLVVVEDSAVDALVGELIKKGYT